MPRQAAATRDVATLERSRGGTAWLRRARPAMGTLVEVAARAADDTGALHAIEQAFAAIARIHAAMSFHEPSSDLSAIARARPGDRVRVTHDTWHVLGRALDFERESHGIFNAAIAPRRVAEGALPAPAGAWATASAASDAPLLATSALAALRLEAGGTVHVLQAVWIDLGGIAKGAAVDAALDALRSAGATAGRVNAGGDLAVFGRDAEAIRVRGPSPGRCVVDAGRLSDGAIATSGAGGDGSALVLPAGQVARWADRSVSVVAPRCLEADALTKVVAALGADAAPLLARHAARAFAIDGRGRIDAIG